MCFLCLKDDIFNTAHKTSTQQYKRLRALEIKQLLKEADDDSLCYIGDETVARLKQEQYKISREM